MSNLFKRLASPFYLSRVGLVALYVVIRILDNEAFKRSIDETTGISKEVILLLLTGMITINRVSRRPVLELKVATFLTLALSYCAVTLYFVSTALWAWFTLACIIVWITTGQPEYSGTRCVEYISGLSDLNNRVLLKNVERRGSKSGTRQEKSSHWLVLFNSPSLPAAAEASFVFASIAAKYHSDLLEFGLVDVDRWPDAATCQGINPSLQSVQLPSLVLYNRGKELSRYPSLLDDSPEPELRYTLTRSFNKSTLSAYFHLPEISGKLRSSR